MKEFFKELWAKDRYRLIHGSIGLVAAVLMLTAGFWATLLMAICVGIGWGVGAHKDGEPTAAEKITIGLIGKKRGRKLK